MMEKGIVSERQPVHLTLPYELSTLKRESVKQVLKYAGWFLSVRVYMD
jgi:hypothetical protein